MWDRVNDYAKMHVSDFNKIKISTTEFPFWEISENARGIKYIILISEQGLYELCTQSELKRPKIICKKLHIKTRKNMNQFVGQQHKPKFQLEIFCKSAEKWWRFSSKSGGKYINNK